MFLRAIVVWFGLLLAAVANGALRDLWISRRHGEQAGHILSTITLCLVILAVSWAAIGWIGPAGAKQALLVGLFWLALTLAFEFLAGHYLFGNPWPKLLADYNLLRGRVWVLVLVTTVFAPVLAIGSAR